ncbi:MAG TPA: ABC transporter permease [Candidatus Angelobacter sp.]|nr:ABC transporter permease [Candidatus Angelobacter sp.]
MRRAFLTGVMRLVAIMLVASFLGAVLLRVAPGFSSDQQELATGLSSKSIQAIRQERLADSNIPRFYAHYLGALVRGDLGRSLSLNQPVKELLRERLPVTLRSLGFALLAGWLLGLALAIGATTLAPRLLSPVSEGLSGVFISTPAAALALLFVLLQLPPAAAAALLVFPKVYRYSRNLLDRSYEMPHVLTAHAKGAGRWRILFWHVAPSAWPQLIALLGVSVSIAIGVLLPIEVICDVPGVGQLAWHAAQSRDLPLLVNLTVIVTFLTVCATTLSDTAYRGFIRSAT